MVGFCSDSFKIATPQQTDDSMRRRPFKLVRPPRQPHVQYYGYAVSPEWLVQFTEQHWSGALPERNDIGYEYMAATRAFELLLDWSGIFTLDSKDCFNPKGGSVPPEWIALYDGDEDDDEADDEYPNIQIDTVHVFALCSDQDESFEARPTQERVDFMTNLIGHTPQWWVSVLVAHMYRASSWHLTLGR
ncbi:uncharacterized protein EDB91DRAFT_1111526 [Suillus paluster]|uniref:uncharacterized protein n=1 Tax=Suillus paluster TaxID=48578 RepID=UPI001B85D3AE|nr:uncharacterized protein EDB91DRAFT_1111526 [Suillus paluster]KAG1748940.1 hypothetical protein EDB91DRAFT_1111526 [Suillus paluster]